MGKIRTDFVTNSSSSSFILSFKDEDSIYNTIKEQFPDNIVSGWSVGEEGYLQQLLNEIENANRLTEKDIEEIVDDESGIKWNIIYMLYQDRNMSYSQAWDFVDSEEGKKMVRDEYNEQLNEIMQKIGDDKVVIRLEHGDGGEGEDGVLEHDILPNMDCTVVQFSHH